MTVARVTNHPEVHEQALRHARRVAPGLFQDAYRLFEEPGTGLLHGSSTCATSPQRQVSLSVAEILALSSSGEECECGGWRSTEFFPSLLVAHRSWELERIVSAGGIDDVAEALEQIDRMQPWWRPDLENLGAGLAAAAALTRENYRIELDLIESFASRFDPSPLLRHVAGHGLRVENDVTEAREFASWVESLSPRHGTALPVRVKFADPTSSVGARAFARRTEARERFDAELDRALEAPRAVVMLERRLWSPVDGATWHTPAEVLLLSFAFGNSPRTSFAWFSAPPVVVAGLRSLLASIPGGPRMGVLESAHVPAPEVRAVVESLWSENAGTWPDLDAVLVAAIALDAGPQR